MKTNLLSIPKYEEFLYSALKPYQPPDMKDDDFESAVDHLMEYNFRQKVSLDKREVLYPINFEKLAALGFMHGKDKELKEVDNKFNTYLLGLANKLVTVLVSHIQQFRAQTYTEVDLLTLPEVYFRCYRVGTYLFGAKVESNSTGEYGGSPGSLRLYSESKYGLFREYPLEDQ